MTQDSNRTVLQDILIYNMLQTTGRFLRRVVLFTNPMLFMRLGMLAMLNNVKWQKLLRVIILFPRQQYKYLA